MALTNAHRQLLADSAITPEVIATSGIESYDHPKHGTGLRFPWSDGIGATVWQYRPDAPKRNDDGDLMKYVFPKGAKVPFNRLRDGGTYGRLILAEGTKQQYAVLSHAPAEFAVYGTAGCWGFKHANLSVAKGRDVFVLLDADFTTNVDVYAAAERMAKELKRHGAKTVRFVSTTGTGKQGVDDVLAALPDEQRAEMLKMWLSQATDKLGRRPKAKQPTDGASKYFRTRDKPIALQPKDVAVDLLSESPGAITPEGNIAIYSNGVYRVDGNAILSKVVTMFGNYYTPSIENTVTRFIRGQLLSEGRVLPEKTSQPLLNCPNTMVDLRDGSTVPHSPDHLSSVQVAVAYDPEASTPLYEAWLRQSLHREGMTDEELDRLVEDIEETAGTMLDPSRTPTKTLFLFGPSRSAKSTFLRLLKAVAGAANTSAVTLHDLASDKFAAANLYGRMLNVAADLSNSHVGDLSRFKMLTGEDVIQANRKYGEQFSFTNQALVAFSANELPTVSEASRAYAERMKPFHFPNSFAGREDLTLESRLMAELPGILARWIRAYGRFLARGGYGKTDAITQAVFEAKSDRVVQFYQDMCTATPARHGQRMDAGEATRRREVSAAFNAWSERNGGSKMGERAFFQRLSSVEGVVEVRLGSSGSRAFNLTVAKADDDTWDEESDSDQSGVPVPDPVPDSADPWGPGSRQQVEDDASAVAQAVVSKVPGSALNGDASGSQEPTEALVKDYSLTASATPPDMWSQMFPDLAADQSDM